jgi:hypothetical protein
MSIIEFQTYVHQGTIEVPKEYVDAITGRVRVIVLTDETSEDIDMVEYLLENPYEAEPFVPFSREELYDRQ